MTLPTFDKTWIFKTNRFIPAASTAALSYANFLFDIKDALTTASGWTDSSGAPAVNANPWTVTSSSNGSTAGLGDKWLSAANVVWGSNMSWVVLRQPAINSLFEFAFGTHATSPYSYVYWAPTLGFSQTGLVPTAYPGDLGDRYLILSGYTLDQLTAAHDMVLHYLMSTDGECTYIFGFYNNAPTLCWMFAKPKNPVAGWTLPAIAFIPFSNAVGPSWTNLWASLYMFGRGLNGSVMNIAGTTENVTTGTAGSTINSANLNEISWEWPIWPVHLVSYLGAGSRGYLGDLYDLWYIPNTTAIPYGLRAGRTMPSSGARQFAVIPALLVPWNNSYMRTI